MNKIKHYKHKQMATARAVNFLQSKIYLLSNGGKKCQIHGCNYNSKKAESIFVVQNCNTVSLPMNKLPEILTGECNITVNK